MTGRRIARRIASMRAPENLCTDGGSSRSLATKVFHLLFQYFLVCVGRGWRWVAERPTPDRQGRHRWSSAGVWSSPQTLNTRRLALPRTPVTTPSDTSTWVTKEGRNGVVA